MAENHRVSIRGRGSQPGQSVEKDTGLSFCSNTPVVLMLRYSRGLFVFFFCFRITCYT